MPRGLLNASSSRMNDHGLRKVNACKPTLCWLKTIVKDILIHGGSLFKVGSFFHKWPQDRRQTLYPFNASAWKTGLPVLPSTSPVYNSYRSYIQDELAFNFAQ